MRWLLKLALPLIAVFALPLIAGEKKAAPPAGTLVDAGSFGVFVNGKRVATETFQIEQLADSSVVRSEFKTDNAGSIQDAELVLAANGDLQRYTWNEVSPGKAQTSVAPQNRLLVQHMVAGPADKPMEQPYILPASTAILDDYFFSQRELLVWRYLSANCRPNAASGGCKLPRAQFGALIPRQRTSMLVNLEYVGRETLNIHGHKRELSRFNLQSDGLDWGLWLDEGYKLIRIYVAADAIEVVRD